MMNLNQRQIEYICEQYEAGDLMYRGPDRYLEQDVSRLGAPDIEATPVPIKSLFDAQGYISNGRSISIVVEELVVAVNQARADISTLMRLTRPKRLPECNCDEILQNARASEAMARATGATIKTVWVCPVHGELER